MKTIPLTQNKVAIVDDEYYQELNKYKWYAHFRSGSWYAQRWIKVNGKRKLILMHKQIIGITSGKDIDHINRNSLDNRRCNLRICSRSDNRRNCKMDIRNKSGFYGVHWCKREKKFVAQIMKNYKKMHLGYFDNPKDAGHAVDKRAIELFGEFATLNFPEDNYATTNP